jgi:hypothetical protein
MVALLGVAVEPCQENAPRELKPVESIAQSGKTRGISTLPIKSYIYRGNAEPPDKRWGGRRERQ